MTRKNLHRTLLIIPVLLIAGAVYGWWYMSVGRFPLAGGMHHDFGTVPIVGRSSSFDHTFELRNRTGETVVIDAIRTGCGCTKAEASTMVVEPGATVRIDATLTLANAGKKKTTIKLMIEDFGPQTLWVQGVGRKDTGLRASTSTVRLVPGVPAQFTVMAALQSTDDEPPAPTVEAPDGVRVSFRGWRAVEPRDPKTARPAQWRGMFDVELADGGPPPGSDLSRSVLTIGLGAAPPVKIRLAVGAPG